MSRPKDPTKYRVRIVNHNENIHRYIVNSFKFEGDIQYTKPPLRDAGPDSVPLLLCKCGCGEFTDNGRSINEYECPCCGQFIEIELGEGDF